MHVSVGSDKTLTVACSGWAEINCTKALKENGRKWQQQDEREVALQVLERREMLHGKCEGVNRKQTGWRQGVSRHYCLTNTKVFFPENSPPPKKCLVFFFKKQENLVNMDVVGVFFPNG